MVINPIVGVYIPIIRIPIKGGMAIPNIATFDHGTDVFWSVFVLKIFWERNAWIDKDMQIHTLNVWNKVTSFKNGSEYKSLK